MGWSSSVCVWGQFSTDGSPLALWLYSSEQYSVHRFSICHPSEAFSWKILDSSSFPLFHRFYSISLNCSLIQFSLVFFMHLLMLLFTLLYFSEPSGSNIFFLSSLLLSQRSRISAVTQVVFFFFFFWRCLPRTGCFSHCCVEGGDHWIYVFIFVAYDGERCKPPVYYSLEGFQHVGIFQIFEVKLESCVFWLADFFQAKAEGHHQQVVITSNVCSWKTSCSGNA